MSTHCCAEAKLYNIFKRIRTYIKQEAEAERYYLEAVGINLEPVNQLAVIGRF
ncbi:MAG: hypothetical protein ACFCU5_04295 [Pleurocapsa sp.]